MNAQYNAPPGWRLWTQEKPIPNNDFILLALNDDGIPSIINVSWCIDFEDIIELNIVNPIIWTYEDEFAANLLAMTQTPAKTLQYMDGNPQTLTNLALQIFEDGIDLGYESFCPYENDPVHHDEPKCRKLMIKNYFNL